MCIHSCTVIFVRKMRESFANAKDSHFFNKKVIVCLIDTLRVDV